MPIRAGMIPKVLKTYPDFAISDKFDDFLKQTIDAIEQRPV